MLKSTDGSIELKYFSLPHAHPVSRNYSLHLENVGHYMQCLNVNGGIENSMPSHMHMAIAQTD